VSNSTWLDPASGFFRRSRRIDRLLTWKHSFLGHTPRGQILAAHFLRDHLIGVHAKDASTSVRDIEGTEFESFLGAHRGSTGVTLNNKTHLH